MANPGCYPTSAILALAPVIEQSLIESDVIVDSKSGVSGGGRSLNMTNHFSEVNENVFAYALQGHRHLPEITQELSALTSDAPSITFLTHLIPMTRGILSSCYAKFKPSFLDNGTDPIQRIREIYEEYYADDPFVRVTPQPPQTKQTTGSNMCLVYPAVDEQAGRLVVVSCLDNLVKGAAGQAVQNMNIMFDLKETLGLEAPALLP